MAYSGGLNNCIFDGLKSDNQQLVDHVSKLDIALEQANEDHVKDKDNEKSEVDGSACKDCGAPLFCMMNNSGEAVPRPSTYTPQECLPCARAAICEQMRKEADGSACQDCGAPLDVVMNRYGRNTHQECVECGWSA